MVNRRCVMAIRFPSPPNSQRLQFVGCLPCPILVRRRTGGGGGEKFFYFCPAFRAAQAGPPLPPSFDPPRAPGPPELQPPAPKPVPRGGQRRPPRRRAVV